MSVTVHIPSPMRSYTGGAARVEAEGSSIDELLQDLDRRFAGFRFRLVDEHGRLRRHIKVFAGTTATEDLGRELGADEDLHIVAALSGG